MERETDRRGGGGGWSWCCHLQHWTPLGVTGQPDVLVSSAAIRSDEVGEKSWREASVWRSGTVGSLREGRGGLSPCSDWPIIQS